MNRIVLFLLAASVIVLTSCETTKEISLQKDGTGSFTTTSDMSGMIGLAKMSGGEQFDKMKEEKPVDTTISMNEMADKFTDLSEEERATARKGALGLKVDLNNDKFITQVTFPFASAKELTSLDKLYSKIIEQVLKKQLDSASAELPQGMPTGGMPTGSIDDYFTFTYSKGLVERKLNAEKYAGLANDENMKAVKELSGMGMGGTTLIINLPFPLKKAEGKNLTVSEDKKKVTIESNTDTFFEDGKALEFRIEY